MFFLAERNGDLSCLLLLLLLFFIRQIFSCVCFQIQIMANSNRRRLSFVDFAHPQAWHKLIEYAEVTIAFTKLS